ncbi:hypothetical protein NFI96_013987 [Prochilodus magdalenae]|nr:hypothetical protein NFI96_013987 [Prochilodus magdalenae]
MKLYVFQVNNGSTLTFDTELAVQTVLDLKHAIQAKYKIATQHQVLVVNGGECMVAERRVCSYSAGTDTNPIFLFNKEMILCDRAPTIPKTTFSIENEMELKVEESLMMPAVFHTVASRTQLAVEMFEVAKKLCSFCERLVHDEHLQHQGWAAIMANLDDCTLSYQKLLWKFDMAYTNYLQDFEDIKLKLTKLGTAVSVMAKIPLLECLTRHSYRESLEKSSSPRPRTEEEDMDNEDGGETSAQSAILCHPDGQFNRKSPTLVSASGEPVAQGLPSSSQNRLEGSGCLQEALEEEQEQEGIERGAVPSFNVTLLDWINVQDRPNDVEAVVRKCFDYINRLDPRIIQPFLADCRDTITKLDNQNMKAIKGLEDRLYALDQMIASCKKLVNEQKELAQGFLANQKRAENLKDTSVLPDLCLSHANQLMIMLTNHRKLLDIKQKCTTAKQELANNLQVRLKWCCYVMLHADQDGEKLQALLRLLTELLERVRVVEALSTVPQMYCLAVVEVVRRKMFVKHYREWANALVQDGKNLYEAEKAKRETFGKLFRKSFLRNRLFRGLDSWPPTSFCTRRPRRFDFELPDISLTDLQYLKSCCPAEVQPFLRVPSLCDFEPLNHHVEALHQLVQAAQSVDEMSRTITDLLSELKVSGSQLAQRPISLTPSIDAHTFDFETIGHPNMDPVLQQGSLDLDSLAESPESDFMSAVNEFVIEENVTKRIQDTTTMERENSRITDDLSHFRGLVLKEQKDFGFALKKMSSEVQSIVNSIKYCHEEELKDMHQNEMENLKADHAKHILDLNQELEGNRNIVRDVQRAMLELEGLVERKEKELSQLEEALASQLDDLHVEMDNNQKKIRQEMEHSEKNRLQELETRLSQEHQALLETLKRDNQNALDALVQENNTKLKELTELYSVERKECEGRLKDYEARVTELNDTRCKLEVEMALKESETEELRLQYEEAMAQQEETLKAETTSLTSALQEQVDTVSQQLQKKNEEYELGLAELRALMRMEKDHCISELVDRHEEESTLLRHEFSAFKQKSEDAEKDLEERLLMIQKEQEDQLTALRKELEVEQRAFQEKEQNLQTTISDLQAENALLSGRLEQERQEAQRREEEEKEAAKQTLNHALKDSELQKEELETRLLGKIKLLENQLEERQSAEKMAEASGQGELVSTASVDWTLQQRLEEERTSLLSKLELLEKKKNEELQNLKTSLIAEQQTNFNTVLTREKLKKEQIISELREKLKEVTLQQEKDKSLIETLSEDRASILQEKKQLEEELSHLRCAVSSTFIAPSAVAEVPGACGPTPSEALALPALDSERLASVTMLRDDDRVDSAVEASMMTVHDNALMLSEEKQRILILERTLHMKEEENKRLSQRLMSQSMSSVSSRHSEKIAIRDFQVGDLVLIILDERHDNYVLFTVGPTLYFLHSESLTALDLKPVTGATRRPWVLGKVMEKEYCQAKKAQNRFKVPLGTKFYRVKAVPWNKKV